ncbi:hypothetical protein [Pseudomonas sp. PICF141]|uniref:hypothetical protein n=1 Tax=Pseudomonas sp. PICF141 TaxID=1949067 RepID=UPI000BAB6A2F|nr:hypothetical protein [Pseudomonas sp. PICF141]PAU61616.1 hypothetical protein BZL43_04395 [Pseudomonas sp. PICF141]
MYDYLQRGILFSWIKKIPQVDRHWARVYLQRKGLSVQANAFEVLSADIPYPDDAHHREIDSQLRNAWRQRKARRKLSGRKAYNFILTSSSKKKLDTIAQDMRSTVTDALRNVIELEHQRIEVHKNALQEVKDEARRLKELSNTAQTISDIRQVLKATEEALYLQTMKSVFSQLQLENRFAQHVPPDALKEEALLRFHIARQDTMKGMGLLAHGLTVRFPDTEELWQKVISNNQPSDTSLET